MRIGKREWFENVLAIPEGKSGAFELRHRVKQAGEPVMASNIRTAFHRGQTREAVTFDHATRWHKLLENDGVWMSDYPIEQIQIDEELTGFRGKVLVGGLGLGYAAVALAQKRMVHEIVVVEKEPDVVALVAPHIAHKKITVVTGDLFDYLAQHDLQSAQFDFGFYDIWQSDGEHTFHTVVMPLRRASVDKVRKVVCWNEIVMRSQLMLGLSSRLMWLHLDRTVMPEDAAAEEARRKLTPTVAELAAMTDVWHGWAAPFWQWVERTNPHPAVAQQKARQYVHYYGIVPEPFMTEIVLQPDRRNHRPGRR